MLLSSCIASSVSGHTESLQGVLQEGSSAPFASLLLVTPARKYWEITGPLQKELRSFIGLEVKITGQEVEQGILYPRFVAEDYTLLSAGGAGGRPLIGSVEEKQGEVVLRSSEISPPLLLTGPLRPTLKTLVGARVWVVGKQEQEKLEVTRFGVIRQ